MILKVYNFLLDAFAMTYCYSCFLVYNRNLAEQIFIVFRDIYTFSKYYLIGKHSCPNFYFYPLNRNQ